MVLIKGKIEQQKEETYVHPTDEDYIGYTWEDYLKADIGLSIFGKIMIFMVITHDYVKQNNEEFSAQLTKFSNSLNGTSGPTALADKYGYDSDQLLSIKNDAAAYAYFILKHGAGASYSKSWTDTGNALRSGTSTVSPTWPMGDPLDDPIPPTTFVLPGIETRFRANASFAKDQKTIYLTADGITMGIEASSSPFVPGAGTPDLEGEVGSGGHPFLKYTKGKYQGVNIYKNSNDGKGFVFSHTVNDPTYTDYAALPAVGVSAVWVYRAFYLYKGEEVGTISKDVSVTVTGIVVTP
jgi:hypothetical protein